MLEICNTVCRCGGIGSHGGLKIPCLKRRVGSSPTSGTKSIRGVAQFGRALALGARCRRFNSCLPDQFIMKIDRKLKQKFWNKRVNAAKESIEFNLTLEQFVQLPAFMPDSSSR